MKLREKCHKCGRFYRIILMREIHDNFGSLPTNAQELKLAVRNHVQLNNIWSFVSIAHGGMLSNIH